MSAAVRPFLYLLVAALLCAAIGPYEGATASPPPCAAGIASEESRPQHVISSDFSGSTLATDPGCLSISLARMTVDLLMPGRIALITFAGDAATHPGTFDLASPAEREAAQQALNDLQAACSSRVGATPLADALDLAREVLDKENAPAGSTVYLLTDGRLEPDTEQQYEAIRALASRFKERGWRVAAVGLEQQPRGPAALDPEHLHFERRD